MNKTCIKEVTSQLESLAPLSYQETYDNSGLLVGNELQAISNVLVTLDCTEEVVDEAIAKQCNLIVAHHPIVFGGLKKLTGKNYVERVVIKAIKNDIALYAIHTNLDNICKGVSQKIADRLLLQNKRILAPKSHTLMQLITFSPQKSLTKVMNALHCAGVGQIGHYKNCSFQSKGTGTFIPNKEALPNIGQAQKLERVEEIRIETIFPAYLKKEVVEALEQAHPYEEVAYYINQLDNDNQEVGLGIIGELETPMDSIAFLDHLKKQMQTLCIKHTALPQKKIKKVAVCGGSGSELLPIAIQNRVDAYVSSDFKYHQFFDAEQKILIADIGHYESEKFTKSLLQKIIKEKFHTFAILLSESITNPIHYYY